MAGSGQSRKFGVIAVAILGSVCVALATALATTVAHAMDSADVLPRGIHSPALRMGVVGGIEQKYDARGRLVTLSDSHSQLFDSRALQTFQPRARRLVEILNQFGHQNLGDELSLGVLRVNTHPAVRYLAPIHAVGVTDRWTLAVGLPILFYENRLSMVQQGSNVAAIHAQTGDGIAELNAAFAELGTDLVRLAASELAAKGYKPLRDRQEVVPGDLQLAALYQFVNQTRWAATVKTLVTFPTGAGDDPDDLADLAMFGESAIEEILVAHHDISPRFRLGGNLSLRWAIPDQVDRRVPESASDNLPGPERQERVNRDWGDSLAAGGSITARVTSSAQASLGFEAGARQADRYSGHRGYDYALLARDTQASWQKLRGGLAYTSVEAFRVGAAPLPFIVAYEVNDTVAGRNIERQTLHEVWMTLFF